MAYTGILYPNSRTWLPLIQPILLERPHVQDSVLLFRAIIKSWTLTNHACTEIIVSDVSEVLCTRAEERTWLVKLHVPDQCKSGFRDVTLGGSLHERLLLQEQG